ncbi:fumarylacetoacetate hydrolase family protein [Rummeliibacillus pycnus]|uniref:fumarylacetoacetate hydrolase family protein n=1 Tax=Rummeliibacillus pycnus TaxID=101070 RepID=UPI001B809979|nr:fumarylacetoacetate hydrolase family protein [Rummeliibacillus pycnus]
MNTIYVKYQGTPQLQTMTKEMLQQIPIDYPVGGTIYGTLLNYQEEFNQLKPLLTTAPYNDFPKAPILYIKPANTLNAHQKIIPLTNDVENVQANGTLAIVIKKNAYKVKKEQYKEFILGYTIANDITIPHENYYRPAILHKSRDGFCPIGPYIVSVDSIYDPNNLTISTFVNGELKKQVSTSGLIRSIGQLLEDVTEFMTLSAGDVLLTGIPSNPPLVNDGDLVSITIDQIGTLTNEIKVF